MSNLRPCPFCGGDVIISDADSKIWTGMRHNVLSWQVTHWCKEPEKGVRGSMITMRAKTQEEAEAKWNHRTKE